MNPHVVARTQGAISALALVASCELTGDRNVQCRALLEAARHVHALLSCLGNGQVSVPGGA